MKKLFVVFMALALLVGVTSMAHAITPVYGGGQGVGTLRTVVLVNNAGTHASTNLSTSYVIPGKCQLFGWSVNYINAATATEVYVSVSAADSGDLDSYLLGESEANNKETPATIFFPKGIEFSDGINVRQGAFTCVTLYYVQVRP